MAAQVALLLTGALRRVQQKILATVQKMALTAAQLTPRTQVLLKTMALLKLGYIAFMR
jgi:hypothetical protein